MKKLLPTSATCLATIAALALAPFTSLHASAEDASFLINCPAEVTVNNEFAVSVSCNSADAFESLTFALKYDSSYLQVKTDQENKPIWNVNTDAGDPERDSVDIMEGETGILYIMMPNDVSYHYFDLDLTFNAISEGTSEFELDIAAIKNGEIDITHGDVAKANITVKPQNSETTTETTTTETTTTTSTETTTTSTSSLTSNNETTTTTSSNLASETTTTRTTTASTESDTTSSSTTQPTNSSTSNTEASSQSTTSTSSTNRNTTTTKSTTTTKTTTTTSNNKNNNGSVDTGDSFPVALLLTSVGVAGVALITTSPRKKDKE